MLNKLSKLSAILSVKQAIPSAVLCGDGEEVLVAKNPSNADCMCYSTGSALMVARRDGD